jgi:serine/threonine protein kinase
MVQLCRVAGGRLDRRALAVKRLNPAIEQEPEFVNMFLDETWITATINSPHVVKVEAWGRDDYGMYLAVELVEGVSLSRLVKESREKQEPFAERTVANIASQICDGLHAAHDLRGENGERLGLVHRDLTPGNVLVSFEGMVKIADFGIAKAEERLTSTRIGMMKGKPAYMAPEQARGGGIDARADLFALGVVIFELLSGRRPWLGTNDLETLVNVSTKEPPKLSDLRKVSPVFVEIVESCLMKNPEKRLGSAREVKAKLDGWRRERGFDADDSASLAAFVQRNTPQQQAWFRQALGGQLQRGGVTFMDLEANIDKGRKKASGGASAVSGTIPSQPVPSAPPAPQPPAGLEEIDDNARTKFMEQRLPQAASPISPKLAATVALSTDELAAMSRRGGPDSPRAGDLPLPPSRMPMSSQPVSAHAFPHQPISAPPVSAHPMSPRTQAPMALTVNDSTSAESAPRPGGPLRTVFAVVLLLGLAAAGYLLVRHFFVMRAPATTTETK